MLHLPLKKWQHNHDFAVKNAKGERSTLYVLILTAITMVVEIIAGSVYGSMALLADGWHMGTHVAAFMITISLIVILENMQTARLLHLVPVKLTYWVDLPVLLPWQLLHCSC